MSGYNLCQGRTQGGCTGCTCIPLPPLCIPLLAMCIPPSRAWKAGEKMRQWATRKKCNITIWISIVLCGSGSRFRSRYPGGGGGMSAKNVHPPWQNPRYAPDLCIPKKWICRASLFPKQIYNVLEMKLGGLVPNSYIHVSASDLYISRISLPILL